MIKVYTDANLLTTENRKIVFPLLFDVYYLKSELANQNFQLVNEIKNADLIIVPISINFYFEHNLTSKLNSFIEVALQANKRVWAYTAGDYGITFRTDVTLFRLSAFASKMKQNEHILPCFVNDFYSDYKLTKFFTLTKYNQPTIGFVGNANGNLLNLSKQFFLFVKLTLFKLFNKSLGDFQNFYPSSFKRYKILRQLKQNKHFETNFILRKKYRAGAKNLAEFENTTQEFYNNIQNNLYTFCIRGEGNFSVRFYETLMMGRIPILLITNFKLPLEDIIEWKNHVIFVNENNFEQKIVNFHQLKTNEELELIQLNNRSLIVNKLQRVIYFKTIYNEV